MNPSELREQIGDAFNMTEKPVSSARNPVVELENCDAREFLYFLPEAMLAELTSPNLENAQKIFYYLCFRDKASGAFTPDREDENYAEFLSEIHAKLISGYYQMSIEQIAAIRDFLEWCATFHEVYVYSKTHSTDSKEIAKHAEECRILSEWLTGETIESPIEKVYSNSPKQSEQTLTFDEYIDLSAQADYPNRNDMREFLEESTRLHFTQQGRNIEEWTFILYGSNKPIHPEDKLNYEEDAERKIVLLRFESPADGKRRRVLEGRAKVLNRTKKEAAHS